MTAKHYDVQGSAECTFHSAGIQGRSAHQSVQSAIDEWRASALGLPDRRLRYSLQADQFVMTITEQPISRC